VPDRRFTARYRRQDAAWLVSASRPGAKAEPVTATGRTLEKARVAIAAALAEALATRRGNVIIDDAVDLSAAAQQCLDEARDARRVALEAMAAHQAASAAAASALLAEGLSLRDVAYLLGVSHTRVLQLTENTDRRENRGRPSSADR
jgi:hypothetical protein